MSLERDIERIAYEGGEKFILVKDEIEQTWIRFMAKNYKRSLPYAVQKEK